MRQLAVGFCTGMTVPTLGTIWAVSSVKQPACLLLWLLAGVAFAGVTALRFVVTDWLSRAEV